MWTSDPTPDSTTDSTPPADRDDREDRRSRWAGVGIVAVLLGLSAFAVWSSQATADAANRTIDAIRLSDDYASAASAVGAEESLERKYRLEPGPEVRARYDAAAASLVSSLDRVARHGTAQDQALVARVSGLHRDYLTSIATMFDAVDRGDKTAEMRIDSDEVDPLFGTIEQLVLDRSEAEHDVAVDQLASLQTVEGLTRRLTPGIFLLGLLLAAWLASVTRRYRRLLGRERAVALHDSLHDSLTGLANRSLLTQRLGEALRHGARDGTVTGLLLIDLDRFKEINDTFGHHYGDELLIQVGPRLQADLRACDTVARLGGDEFAVVLPDVEDVAAVMAVAEALRERLEHTFPVEGIELDVEASVGVVLSGHHGDDVVTLLQRADIAMYVAKTQQAGVVAYDSQTDDHSPARLALLGDLRRALDLDELVLHFQPQVCVSTGQVTGAEALVRWEHPDRGLVYPDAFIPVAEHTGLIGPLTRHVLSRALAQAKEWQLAGDALPVAVNLSARNLLDERLVEQVADLLREHEVDPSLLQLEVTESAIMADPARATRILGRLGDLGVAISIDDFGVGYTSLGQLKTLPVSELKVDRSFVTHMCQESSDALIVHSVVDLGHHLGFTIVAEGVEDEQALDLLAAYGCDTAQGYHLSRPVDAEAFTVWRRAHEARIGARVEPDVTAVA